MKRMISLLLVIAMLPVISMAEQHGATTREDCFNCSGTGEIDCDRCGGDGWVND